MPKKMKTCVIIDGNAIIHRAYHALPPLTAKDGTMVNAVYGFASMLMKVMHDLTPDYIATTFDMAGETFRDELYADYKATRVKADQSLYDQIPLVHRLVETFNIPIYTREGFEADDLIGTLARDITRTHDDIRVIIVTGDKDLLQLVDDKRIEVYLLRKGMSDFTLFDEDKVRTTYHFAPSLMIDYKALRGDSSDNIPGVKGIGDKTATTLITTYGTLDDIYATADRDDTSIAQGVKKKLLTHRDDAYMSKELATIKVDVPDISYTLDDMQTVTFDRAQVIALFQEFEFYSLAKRLTKNDTHKDKDTHTHTASQRKKIVTVTSSLLKQVSADLSSCETIGVAPLFEQTPADILHHECRGIVCLTREHAWLIPLTLIPKLNLFDTPNHTLVGHNLKTVVKVCMHHDIPLTARLFDTMIASYLINSSTRAHDIRSIALRELGIEIPLHTQTSLFGTDTSTLVSELDISLRVYDAYRDALEKDADLGLFEEVEMGLIPVLAHMELSGVSVDTTLLGTLSESAARTILTLEKKIHTLAGKSFNVASSTQLRDILFDTLELPTEGIKKGKTGYSTAASELEKLHGIHPIIELIEEFREIEKLRNTYIDVLPTLINPRTKRIHTTFNQAVTTTGRLSSSDPNLQNIPIRTELGREVRTAFIAERGNVLVAADYSQIELRIAASLANDATMIAIFERGEDIHTATAAAIHNIPLDQVSKDIRRSAKEVNFGVLYGMGAFGLSARTGISPAEAREFIDRYFETFSGVKQYLDETLAQAQKTGYVETLFGRKRYIPELLSSQRQVRLSGERMAINMPIQGTAADLMKKAMIAVYHALDQAHLLHTHARITLQVHDEIVCEVKQGSAEQVAKIIQHEMEQVTTLRVPIDVHVNIGDTWGDM